MKPQIEPALLAEMTLFPAEPEQPAQATRPQPRRFTREELEEAARTNPWVRMNIVVPQTAKLPRGTKPRTIERNLRADIPH